MNNGIRKRVSDHAILIRNTELNKGWLVALDAHESVHLDIDEAMHTIMGLMPEIECEYAIAEVQSLSIGDSDPLPFLKIVWRSRDDADFNKKLEGM